MIKIDFYFIRSLCFLAERKNFDRRVQIKKIWGFFNISQISYEEEKSKTTNDSSILCIGENSISS